MEYLQYFDVALIVPGATLGFKPYYKWNTFNTILLLSNSHSATVVLNLIINGIPSILWEHISEAEYEYIKF